MHNLTKLVLDVLTRIHGPLHDALAAARAKPGIILVDGSHPDRGSVEELAWVAGWRVRIVDATGGIPCIEIGMLRYCGRLGDMLIHTIPYVIAYAAGWKNSSCPSEVCRADEIKAFVVDGLPCTIALPSLAHYARCSSVRVVVYNAYDYAKAYGKLPVKRVPSIGFNGRWTIIPHPYTVHEVSYAVRRVAGHG